MLLNLEDVYKATWISSIFIMTAQKVEICWSREDISAGEQAQAALIQEEEAVTASACMYCQHQHTDRRKGFANSWEFEPLGSLAWLCSYHQYISTRDIICSHTSCSPQRRAERCIRILQIKEVQLDSRPLKTVGFFPTNLVIFKYTKYF